MRIRNMTPTPATLFATVTRPSAHQRRTRKKKIECGGREEEIMAEITEQDRPARADHTRPRKGSERLL